MDKLLNIGKSKSPTLLKLPNTPWGQFWDLRGHLEVKMYFFKALSCQTKKKVSLYLNLNAKHTQRSILGLERSSAIFLRTKCSSMDKLLNKDKGKAIPQFKVPNTPWHKFWDFRRHLEVILRSFKGQVEFFLEINVVQWIRCWTKEK